MSKTKLTLKADEMEKVKLAFELAEIKIIQTLNLGDFNKVEISYKTEQQIFNAGRFVDSVKIQEPAKEVKTKNKKQNEQSSKNNRQD